jgi:putative transposase
VLHLIRNTFRLASRADWDRMARDLRPVYTAINEADAAVRLAEFHQVWGDKYPAIRSLWARAWSEFVPFLDNSPEIRPGDLLDQRHRVVERPVPASHTRPRALPQRTGRAQNASTLSCARSTRKAPGRNTG